MSTITDYEKIATIYFSAQQGMPSGTFGKAVHLDAGSTWRTRVEVAGGPVVLIRPTATGLGTWQVSFKGFIGEDGDLEQAARLALDAGRGVSVTRNYPIGG